MGYRRPSLCLGLRFDLVQVALRLRLHVIDLIGGIAGDVALKMRTRHHIRSAEELPAVLVNHIA